MRAAATDGQGNVWIADVPVPEPNEYQCLCRIEACATCTGTDQKHLLNKLPWKQEYPGLLGHESVGRVVQVGRKVTAFREGDRVLRPAAVFPGERHAGYTSMWGGFAEYGLVLDAAAWRQDHPDSVPNNYSRFQLRVPDELGISAADATMLITLKECASYVADAGIGFYKSVAVLGSGAVAYGMTRFAKILGAYPVIMVGRRASALERGASIGADLVVDCTRQDVVNEVRGATGGRGVDFIIDTTGDAGFLAACMGALTPEGVAVPYATYESGDTVQKTVDPARVRRAATGEDKAHQYLLDAVRLGLVRLDDYYSHKLPFEQIEQGFQMLRDKEAFKIVFEMEG